MTAHISADLGMTAPGDSASASLGTVQVTNTRGFGADWTATVSATGFTTGWSVHRDDRPFRVLTGCRKLAAQATPPRRRFLARAGDKHFRPL